jgi:hypothetical protein
MSHSCISFQRTSILPEYCTPHNTHEQSAARHTIYEPSYISMYIYVHIIHICSIYIYTHIYIHIYTHTHIYEYIYMYGCLDITELLLSHVFLFEYAPEPGRIVVLPRLSSMPILQPAPRASSCMPARARTTSPPPSVSVFILLH